MHKQPYITDPRYSENSQGSKMRAQGYRMEKVKALEEKKTQLERTGKIRNRDGSYTYFSEN